MRLPKSYAPVMPTGAAFTAGNGSGLPRAKLIHRLSEVCTIYGISTSPFRKLRIAESEYGLQNFTESGYGFRIYGIEVDMYGISRVVILDFFLSDSTLTDSTNSRIPFGFRQKRSATPPRRSPPPRARGILLGLEPHHGVEQAAAICYRWPVCWQSTS
jgi:hypothetical protein